MPSHYGKCSRMDRAASSMESLPHVTTSKHTLVLEDSYPVPPRSGRGHMGDILG